ncbi:hypothetical protein [[Eubacterium] cellulosolvens]
MRNIETGNLILKLLENTYNDEKISVSDLASKARFSTQMTADIVDRLSMQGLLVSKNETIIVNRVNRIQLAVEAVNIGMDWERICRTLGFREFEDITAEAFRENNFKVYSRFVFRHDGKRSEIDVVGQREHIIICADCKHWSRGMSTGQLLQIIKKQVERTQMLVNETKICKNRFNFKNESEILFIPIIITLGNPKNRIIKKVPIIPVLALRSFLAEFDLYLKNLTIFKLIPKRSNVLGLDYFEN